MKGTTLALLGLPFGTVIVLAIWLRHRWIAHLEQHAKDLREANKLIKPPTLLFVGHDEALELRTKLRRDAAARLKKRAHQVETGERVSDILRAVK